MEKTSLGISNNHDMIFKNLENKELFLYICSREFFFHLETSKVTTYYLELLILLYIREEQTV